MFGPLAYNPFLHGAIMASGIRYHRKIFISHAAKERGGYLLLSSCLFINEIFAKRSGGTPASEDEEDGLVL